jgi:hypothetical protein
VTGSNSGVRALEIDRDPKTEYWIEFRQRIRDNPLVMNGVRLHRLRPSDATLDLLNPNPGAPHGATDAALVIGRTFADAEAKIYVTPVQVNRTEPASIDVVVNRGDPPAHQTLAVDVAATAMKAEATTQPIEFTAHMENGDHIPFAIAWDFGDGTFTGGTMRVSHLWKTPDRQYVVRATVNDLWGHEASKMMVVSVGNAVGKPLLGTVTDGAGAPLEGVRVNVIAETPPKTFRYGQDTTLSDSAGQFAFPAPAHGRYTVRPLKYGCSFMPVKLECPATAPLSFIAAGARPAGKTSTLRIRGKIDGTDELRITHANATWKHGQYGWPGDVKLNEVVLDPHKELPNTGGTTFLPANADFASAVLSKRSARGNVDIYRDITRGSDALVITFDDPQPGADDYELELLTATDRRR